jgi:hypothetical protein
MTRPLPAGGRGRLLAGGLGLALTLGAVPAAHAATNTYTARSFTEPANPGLTVQPPLDEFRAVSRARVIVPSNWTRLSAPAGRLRFLTAGTAACRYRVTFTVHTTLAATGEASARLDQQLPSPGAQRVLDSGTHGAAAFRVVRPVSSDARVRLNALRTTVLTRRTDIVPSGQAAWSDLTATAISRPGDECHSGTYRQALGPQLGDALATARTTLDFVRPSS